MGVDQNNQIPADFPGKVIPAGNGANVVVTSLDKIINWGEKYKIWIILDLHAAVGCQNHDWHRFPRRQHLPNN